MIGVGDMEFNIYSVLVDLMFASILFALAKFLRSKVKLIQSLFIPVSLLAGLIGLLLGQNGLGLIKFSDQFGSYAGLLIIVVFVSIGLRGFNFSTGGFKENVSRLGKFYCHRNIGWAFQYSMPILFSLFILTLFASNLNPAFGFLIPAGFQGGHGTAAALGDNLSKLGWTDAPDLAMTAATVGILTGIFGGIALIKMGTKKGYTSYVKDFGKLSPELRTGLLEGKE